MSGKSASRIPLTLLLLGSLVMIFPFWWMLVTSLSTPAQASASATAEGFQWWPTDAQWRNFPTALRQMGSRPWHGFLDALPKGPLYAVELRTAAFLTDSYSTALLATGAAHCYSVHPAMASLERQLDSVQAYRQPALLVRWMLRSGLRYEVAKERYEPFDAIVDEDAETRERIAIAALDALIAEKEVFVIANNKAEGSAPLSIFRLAERIAEWDTRSEGGA